LGKEWKQPGTRCGSEESAAAEIEPTLHRRRRGLVVQKLRMMASQLSDRISIGLHGRRPIIAGAHAFLELRGEHVETSLKVFADLAIEDDIGRLMLLGEVLQGRFERHLQGGIPSLLKL